MDGTTDKVFDDDVTPAITGQTAGVLPSSVSFSIIGFLAAALIATIAVIHSQTDATPTGVITPKQLSEFVAKKNALTGARALLDAGRYDDSVQAYDNFLKRYPKSIAGQQGRAEAVKAADAHKAKTTVTAQASKSRSSKETAKKPSLWQRIFRRNRTK